MAETKKNQQLPDVPHGHRDRGTSDDQPRKGTKTTTGSHDPEAARLEAEKTFAPDRDGSDL